ncbi:MAG TPA: hypothetical protein VGD40_06040 [Chryseosolibacter sp.]
MKAIHSFIAFALLSQVSCSSEDVAFKPLEDDPSITTLNGTWKAISFEDYVSGTVETKTQENSWGEDIVLTFDDTTSPGAVRGKITTNAIEATFQYKGARQIHFEDYFTTYVGQPKWADYFKEVILDEQVAFEINNVYLRIFSSDKSKSVTMLRQ